MLVAPGKRGYGKTLPWRDAIHADTHVGQFNTELLRKRQHAALAHAIVARELVLASDVSGHRGDVDDRAGAGKSFEARLAVHLPGGELGTVVQTEVVDLDASLDRLGITLQKWLVGADTCGCDAMRKTRTGKLLGL